MFGKHMLIAVLVLTVVAGAQKTGKRGAPGTGAQNVPAAAEDISGMYTFLKEGEFLQINLEQHGVSGYVSRQGDLESDRGEFLDQFFTKASLHGHDISFTTKAIHGVWFEFKGRFSRGSARTRAEDGYYVLRGTLTQFISDAQNNSTSRSREVEFTWLAQPDES